MKTNRKLTVLVLIVLIAAMALCLTACGGKDEAKKPEGGKSFEFTVVDLDGGSKVFNLSSDADTVGDALLNEGLIAGEDGPYGLYVKTVNGITLDYDTDGHYWAFYIGDEYAMTGVDQTELADGGIYAFKAE